MRQTSLPGGSARLSLPRAPKEDSSPRYFHKWGRIGTAQESWAKIADIGRFHCRVQADAMASRTRSDKDFDRVFFITAAR